MNLSDNITRNAETFQSKTALVFYSKQISYSELENLICNYAEFFLQIGFKKGDKLIMCLPNIPEFVICFYALIKIGATAILVNPTYQLYEIEYIIKDSEAKGIISHSFFWKTIEALKTNSPEIKTICVDNGNISADYNLQSIFSTRVKKNTQINSENSAPDYPACIVYTNAESGRPMGAMLSNENLDFAAYSSAKSVNILENDTLIAAIPLFHTFSLTVNLNMPLKLGGKVVLNERYSIERLLSDIEKEKVTLLVAVPKTFYDITSYTNIEKYDLSSLNFAISGGAVLPNSVCDNFEKKLKVPLLEGYGLTEGSPVCSVNRVGNKKNGTIGYNLPEVEIKIFDKIDNELPPLTEGEICIRGKNVMSGYYKNEESTAQNMRNGWFHTGDTGYIDKENFVTITGRKKRVIINGGFNVYCAEVEKVIKSHHEIIDCYVYGIYNKDFGESVCADVTIKEKSSINEDMLKIYCHQFLARYKCPRKINILEELNKDKYNEEIRKEIIKKIRES